MPSYKTQLEIQMYRESQETRILGARTTADTDAQSSIAEQRGTQRSGRTHHEIQSSLRT